MYRSLRSKLFSCWINVKMYQSRVYLPFVRAKSIRVFWPIITDWAYDGMKLETKANICAVNAWSHSPLSVLPCTQVEREASSETNFRTAQGTFGRTKPLPWPKEKRIRIRRVEQFRAFSFIGERWTAARKTTVRHDLLEISNLSLSSKLVPGLFR